MAGRRPAPLSPAAVPDSAAVPAGNPPPADVWGRRLSDGAGAVKQIQIEGIRQATPQPSGFARATRPKQEAALARNLEKSTCKFHFASKSGKAVSTLHRAKTSVKSAGNQAASARIAKKLAAQTEVHQSTGARSISHSSPQCQQTCSSRNPPTQRYSAATPITDSSRKVPWAPMRRG